MPAPLLPLGLGECLLQAAVFLDLLQLDRINACEDQRLGKELPQKTQVDVVFHVLLRCALQRVQRIIDQRAGA